MHSGSPSHMQRPDAHSLALAESQTVPQPPQLLTSDCVFVHVPVQQA